MSYQTVPVTLRSPVFAASGQDSISLATLPDIVQGGIAHLESIDFVCAVTPTLSSGSLTIQEAQNIVTTLQFHDGENLRFDGSFGVLRLMEALENGGAVSGAESDSAATTETIYFVRRLRMGPANFLAPQDFLLPVPALKSAKIDMRFGALTDLDANCTAVTVSIAIICNLVPRYGAVLVPPMVRRGTYSPSSADFTIQGKALHAFLAMANSSSLDAITAGDFANITVEGAAGTVIGSIHAADLHRQFQASGGKGQLQMFGGEPRAATDDNGKVVSGTAVAAAPASLSVVLYAAQGQKITKLTAIAGSGLRLRWSGTQASAYLLSCAILAQEPGAQSSIVARALGQLNMRRVGAPFVKTASKRGYTGVHLPFMATEQKVG